MMKKISSFFILARILLEGRSSYKFALSIIVSFAFSIAVVLSTVGIMDGFEDTLKKGLKKASGDFSLTIRNSHHFFHFDSDLKKVFSQVGIKQVTPIIQMEGFLIHEDQSQAVLIKGIETESFRLVSGLNLDVGENEIILGKEIKEQLNLSVGDEITLAHPQGGSHSQTLPLLKRYKIKGMVEHGIYKKDLRFVYLNIKDLQENLLHSEQVNLISFNIPKSTLKDNPSSFSVESIHYYKRLIEKLLKPGFVLKPFWAEFSSLIDAVQVEKFMITLILQLVVIVSIFNVIAFVIFLNEKKSQEIFLMQAFGVAKSKLQKIWFFIITALWFLSCILSLFFTNLFNYLLGNLSILKMPGDIYNLTRFTLKIELHQYLFVFMLALFWVFMIAMIGIIRIHKKSILSGLRKEFN